MKAKKTNPRSIRFNINDLEKALAKSEASSPQELVDLLLKDYVSGSVKLIAQETQVKNATKEPSKAEMFKLMREGKM